MNLFNELKRRNVFKVTAAYIIIGWLLMQVGDTLGPALLLPEWVNSALAFFIILGFPLALFFAWAFELTPEGIKKEHKVERSESVTHVTGQKLNYIIMVLMALALGYFAFDKFVLDPQRDAGIAQIAQQAPVETQPAVEPEPGPDERSIAVMPFINMSDDASNEFFSDGITEELINLMARIPELRVTSRSSAFSFKGQNVDIPTVAEKLNVAHILEGSVRKAGNRVRITAQLIRVDSDVHIWSDTYERELDDVFAIQDEIAQKVVAVLQIKLLGEIPVVAKTDSKAYTLYLQGKHFYALTDRINTQASTDAFRKALEIDPGYAPAWAGLGRTQRSRANWGEIDLREGTEEARQAALKALELDDTLADAWAMLAYIQWVYDWDWERAAGTAKTALLHGPNDAWALEVTARIAISLGHFDDALKYAREAVEVDPLNPFILRSLALTYWVREEHELEQEVFERVRDLYPNRPDSHASVAFAILSQGRPEEALAALESESAEELRTLGRAFALHDLGRQEEAQQALQFVIESAGDWLAYQIAEAHAYMGDTDDAFRWLETSYEMRDGGITYLITDPTLKSLYSDPRWEPLLLKVGLLNAWQELQVKRAEASNKWGQSKNPTKI